jgi:hypothetical protein
VAHLLAILQGLLYHDHHYLKPFQIHESVPSVFFISHWRNSENHHQIETGRSFPIIKQGLMCH